MNTIRVLTAIVFVSLSTSSIADVDGDAEIEKAKQAAVDRCMSAAQERYGEASASSRTRKASVGSQRGYKVRMKVGKIGKKKIECYALNNGEVRFFTAR